MNNRRFKTVARGALVAAVLLSTLGVSVAQEQSEEAHARRQAALKPIIMNAMIPEYIAEQRVALLSEARGEKSKRVQPFPRAKLDALVQYYQQVGVDEYNWHTFGPNREDMKWHYYSFDPQEKKPLDAGGWRFRKVTYPEGMSNWFAVDFDAEKAGWKTGLAPFGQLDGKLQKEQGSCRASFCRCGDPMRTLWEKEVLLIRGTFKFPPAKEGYRYRVLVGGGSHVNGGEGYAIYINGKQLIEYPQGAGKRQGGAPRGGFVYKELANEFQRGKVTIAATSFLNRTKGIPKGHFSVWLEEMKIPPLGPLGDGAKKF